MHLSGLLFDVDNVLCFVEVVKKKVYFILSRRKTGARRGMVFQDRTSPKSKELLKVFA